MQNISVLWARAFNAAGTPSRARTEDDDRRAGRRSAGHRVAVPAAFARIFALFCAVLSCALPQAHAAQIYATQGYVDYVVGGTGARLQNNGSNTTTCASTSQAAYFETTSNFSVTLPAGSTVDRAFLIWSGSSDIVDTTGTLTLNGGTATAVTGTSQLATSSTGLHYYETRADVTGLLAAAAPAGGTVNVSITGLTFKATTPDNWRDFCAAAAGITLVVVHTTDFNNPAIEPRAVVIDDAAVVLQNGSYTGNITGVAAAATVPNARATMVLVEGDSAINTGEDFTFNGTSYTAVNWDEGDQNRAALNAEGNSWEIDTVAPTVPAGSTSATFGLTSGQDTVMPVVMAVSWSVRADYGDAPASYGIARHTPVDLSDAATRLGTGIDFEGGSLFSTDANGDDADTSDDETGITSLPVLTVASATYTVSTACAGGSDAGVNQTGFVSAWIDFNRNGSFDNPAERAQATCAPGASSTNLTWTIAPDQIVAGLTYLRVRIARIAAQVANPVGNAISGEVEDYALDIAPVITVNKTVWPEADTGVFNFAANGTSIGTDIGDDGSTGVRTVYHKPLNNYNGMAGVAPHVTVAQDIGSAAVPVTITESSGTGTDLADYTTTVTCVNATGATVFTADPAITASFSLPASTVGTPTNGQAQNITCNYTNYTAKILVAKNTDDGTDGTFAYIASGNKATNFNITTAGGTGSAVIDLQRINADLGTGSETIAETVPAGWRLDSIVCTYLALDGSTGSAGTITLPAVTLPLTRGYDYTCTFLNHKLRADLQLTKTNTPGVNSDVDQAADTLVSGTVTTYTITVSNSGPDAADGAVITDPAPSNLSCTTATCLAAGGATCPAETGAALLAALQGAGATAPTLPNGGSVTITTDCTVN